MSETPVKTATTVLEVLRFAVVTLAIGFASGIGLELLSAYALELGEQSPPASFAHEVYLLMAALYHFCRVYPPLIAIGIVVFLSLKALRLHREAAADEGPDGDDAKSSFVFDLVLGVIILSFVIAIGVFANGVLDGMPGPR